MKNNCNINMLKGINIFQERALEHIFHGEINKYRRAIGCHHDYSCKQFNAKISRLSTIDKNGIYIASVIINNIPKTGISTIFSSIYYSEQDVVNSINEAYNNKKQKSGCIYIGTCSSGLEIIMILNTSNKIITAYPLYSGKNQN